MKLQLHLLQAINCSDDGGQQVQDIHKEVDILSALKIAQNLANSAWQTVRWWAALLT